MYCPLSARCLRTAEREALEAAIPTLEPARERFWRGFEETPTLEAYEVADQI